MKDLVELFLKHNNIDYSNPLSHLIVFRIGQDNAKVIYNDTTKCGSYKGKDYPIVEILNKIE